MSDPSPSVTPMIEPVWLHVLQQIPDELRGTISVVTTTGAELVVQQIFVLERAFMVVRARTAGTMDTGRTIIVAYSQIDFVAFNGKMGEEEAMAIFSEPVPDFAGPQVVYQPMPVASEMTSPAPLTPLPRMTPQPSRPTPSPAAATAEPEPATPAESAPAQKPGQISKTILLARLRERLSEKGK